MEVAHPAAEVVVNISPQDTTEANGSVELWPGSHLDVSGRHIDEEHEAERSRNRATTHPCNCEKRERVDSRYAALAPWCTKPI